MRASKSSAPDAARGRSRVGLLLGSGLVAIVLCELAVRALLPYYTPGTIRAHSLPWTPSLYSAQRLEPVDREIEIDQRKGWGKKPKDEPPERVFYINDQGYRGRPFSVSKPEGTTRILMLGGSSTFDLHASVDLDWPNLLEVRLRERLGRADIEVINAGLPGSASIDSIGRLLTQAWIYEPDYTLLYHAWNDVKYFGSLSPEQPLLSLYEPQHAGSNPFTTYQNRLDYLACRSQLYVRLRSAYLSKVLKFATEGRLPPVAEADEYGEQGLRQFQLIVETFVDLCRNIGSEPILLTQALLVAADNSEEDRARIDYRYQGLAHEALVRALTECNATLREVGQRKGAAVVDLDAQLGGRPELFKDHVHTSAAGSAALADALADFLAAELGSR